MSDQQTSDLWSIGHSNVSFSKFSDLLVQFEISEIADVRSVPFSRYTPHFNRENLEAALKQVGIRYSFMGESLGGRPPETDLYDEDGYVLYGLLAKNFRFLQGIEELCIRAEQHRVAMMCSEESPENCHRRLLIGRVLREQGIETMHIHGSGKVSSDLALEQRFGPHKVETLFGVEEEPWKSIRPVLQSGQLRDSLEP
jgi:uncharacterized protein (DUF488 family)